MLKALQAGLAADPEIDTGQTEATLQRLTVQLDSYREARQKLDRANALAALDELHPND